MRKSEIDTLLLILMGVVILLLITDLGLFLRMNQLQSQVLQALEPLHRQQLTGIDVGIKAPAFSLYDSNDRLVSLNEFSGRRILLVFSSTT
jgi:hypothetical protein